MRKFENSFKFDRPNIINQTITSSQQNFVLKNNVAHIGGTMPISSPNQIIGGGTRPPRSPGIGATGNDTISAATSMLSVEVKQLNVVLLFSIIEFVKDFIVKFE